MVARIKTVLRRTQPTGTNGVIKRGKIEIDTDARKVQLNGKPIKLGPIEYRLLKFLMTKPDRVFTRSQLLDRVWGGNIYIEERTVDVHIRRLRVALSREEADQYIHTVRGSGYRFSLEPKEQ